MAAPLGRSWDAIRRRTRLHPSDVPAGLQSRISTAAWDTPVLVRLRAGRSFRPARARPCALLARAAHDPSAPDGRDEHADLQTARHRCLPSNQPAALPPQLFAAYATGNRVVAADTPDTRMLKAVFPDVTIAADALGDAAPSAGRARRRHRSVGRCRRPTRQRPAATRACWRWAHRRHPRPRPAAH